MGERAEALMRIVVGIVSGIILGVWKALVQIIAIIHFFYALFSGKRNKGLAEFVNYWNTQIYMYLRYMTFTTNKRPFPFSELGKNLEPTDLKK
ncbi:MAG: DUF4389 domain-containing protein [Candidatus Woesearchaeota archaeon]